ncbi:MAG TPA: YkgJ family cysteine cluster protein [Candidatus Bathyarchaeia archaeon]|nr:YkgJ family cysteine cluster protein [Candidatus Bathyarchaeia archaeon]
METDIAIIKEASKEKAEENWAFRAYLRECNMSPEEIDAVVHRLSKEISSKIDCKACANCCKMVTPVLDEDDIVKLSAGLGISTAEFYEEYLVEDEDGLKFKMKPCPFLKDNSCWLYAYRPKDCRSYPHLHKEGFVFRLMEVIANCSVCPIVFNVYETLKEERWHKDPIDFDEGLSEGGGIEK